MTRPSKLYGLLGLARRAGAVAPGLEVVRETIRDGQARLVLLAADASRAQLEKVERTLAGHPVARATLGTRAELGAALGLGPISAVAVTHATLAEQMLAELDRAAAPMVLTGVEG